MNVKHIILAALSLAAAWAAPVKAAPSFPLGPVETDWKETGFALAAGARVAFAVVPGGDEPVYAIYDRSYRICYAGNKYGPFSRIDKDYYSPSEGFSFAKGIR
jgi:hypothetical protein